VKAPSIVTRVVPVPAPVVAISGMPFGVDVRRILALLAVMPLRTRAVSLDTIALDG
jgi:hypothetical protein